MSYHKTYILIVILLWMLPSTSVEIIEQIGVLEEVVLSEVCKLDDSVINKKSRGLNTEKKSPGK